MLVLWLYMYDLRDVHITNSEIGNVKTMTHVLKKNRKVTMKN